MRLAYLYVFLRYCRTPASGKPDSPQVLQRGADRRVPQIRAPGVQDWEVR